MHKAYKLNQPLSYLFLCNSLAGDLAKFWNEIYVPNHELYDRRFVMKYSSFRYFDSVDTLPIDDPTEIVDPDETVDHFNWRRFSGDIGAHLTANMKMYAELYRIHCIDDDKYSLYDNYNIKEIMDRDTTSDVGSQTNDGTEDIGQRSDNGSKTDDGTEDIGQKHDSNSHSVAPYDSDTVHLENSNSLNYGEQHNASHLGSTNSYTYGSQHNTNKMEYGSRHDSGTEDYTLTKVGNIGVQTVTDMIRKHRDFWTNESFIDYVFEQISKELLLVD